MDYALVQTKYRCHCGIGSYLGYKFYPQPFFLLQLAGKLRREGYTVCLVDLFRNHKAIIPTAKNRVYHIGEYAADSMYKPFSYPVEGQCSGAYPWLHRERFAEMIVEPEAVFNEFPALDLIDFDDYPAPQGRKRAVIRLSLGCPNHCIFCPVPVIYKGKYHRFDDLFAKGLIGELKNRGVKEISIIDDNLFADMRLGKKLLNWIIKADLDIRFCVQEGIEVKQALDYEFCGLLKKANFYDIRLGVETLDAEALKYVRKDYQDPQMALAAVKNLKDSGLTPLIFLVEGLSKNKNHTLEDIKLFENLGCKVRNHKLHLYPNTVLFKENGLGLV